ncbi:MAG TPA: response regulator transcription factor [Stellaceae bacterium]|nr:response regulator transcription factor [Stellaceae bacterium]
MTDQMTEIAGTPSPALSAPLVTPPVVRSTRIVLVDDEDDFRESLGLNLEDEGFQVASFGTAAAAVEHLASGGSADVILLDWRMPEVNGLEMLRELRQRDITTPVIFLTGLGDDVYEEAALAGGAVDFIDKSRRLSILVKRIEIITDGQRPLPEAAPQASEPAQLRLGPLELRFDISRAFWRGRPVELTLTEFRMVGRLALKPGEDVSYREIYDLVHGKDFVAGSGTDGYRANVRTFIKRIRKKFRDLDAEFALIHNYPGFGYRWVPE